MPFSIIQSSFSELIVDISSYAGNWLRILLSQGQHQSHCTVLVSPCTSQTWYVFVRLILASATCFIYVSIPGLPHFVRFHIIALHFRLQLLYHFYFVRYKLPYAILFSMTKEPEELFETISQALLSSVDRDCLSGWGGYVLVV